MALNRSESMKRAWIARRTSAQKLAAWHERPTCLCCGALLVMPCPLWVVGPVTKYGHVPRYGHTPCLWTRTWTVDTFREPIVSKLAAVKQDHLTATGIQGKPSSSFKTLSSILRRCGWTQRLRIRI